MGQEKANRKVCYRVESQIWDRNKVVKGIQLWKGYSCGRNKSYERHEVRERKRDLTDTILRVNFICPCLHSI